jgi:indolepyruvate ferredoxin oxidoreductase alpha subunit
LVREISTLRLATAVPFPWTEVQALLEHCQSVVVFEELEPHVERGLHVAARRVGFEGTILGKLDGPLSPIGELGLHDVQKALNVALGVPAEASTDKEAVSIQPAPRPITVCAGCPHRGTYLSIDKALHSVGLSKDRVMITGDIGCTILGMNPPFDLLWNEVSMGSSVSLAQGYAYAGLETPVIATIGDSTFFHGGIPGLINAIQHRVPLTLIVMDNGWTGMTGMQVNPGTSEEAQPNGRRVDIEAVLRGLGPDRLDVVDPYDLDAMSAVLADGLQSEGVKVVLAQRECAIQAKRRGVVSGWTTVNAEACVLCKRCLKITGCPALSVSMDGTSMTVDASLCNGCGVCSQFCPTGALTTQRREGIES